MSPPRILASAAIYCAGVGAAAQISKLGPVLDEVAARAEVELAAATLLVSIIGLAGLVFGTAVGAGVGRFGPVRALAFAFALALVAGLALPSAPGYSAFAALRIVESAAHLVVVTAAPGLITLLAPPDRRAAVLAIWGSFFGVAFVGSQALSALAPAQDPATFLRLHAFLFVPFLLLLGRGPLADALAAERAAPRRRDPGSRTRSFVSTSLAPGALDAGTYAALAFACHSGATTALLTLVPGEAQRRWGLDAGATAVLATSLPMIWLGSTLAAGAALRRIGAVPVVAAGGAVVLAGLAWLALVPADAAASLSVAFVGFGLVQAGVFARIAALASDVQGVARLSGAYTQLGNAGILVCAPLTAAALPVLGSATLPICASVAAAGVVAFQLASLQAERGRRIAG